MKALLWRALPCLIFLGAGLSLAEDCWGSFQTGEPVNMLRYLIGGVACLGAASFVGHP